MLAMGDPTSNVEYSITYCLKHVIFESVKGYMYLERMSWQFSSAESDPSPTRSIL